MHHTSLGLWRLSQRQKRLQILYRLSLQSQVSSFVPISSIALKAIMTAALPCSLAPRTRRGSSMRWVVALHLVSMRPWTCSRLSSLILRQRWCLRKAPSMSSGICCPKVGFKFHNEGLIPWDDKTPWNLSELNINHGVVLSMKMEWSLS